VKLGEPSKRRSATPRHVNTLWESAYSDANALDESVVPGADTAPLEPPAPAGSRAASMIGRVESWIDRRTFLGATAAGLLSSLESEAPKRRPPNWLVLVGDDHSRADVGAYGHEQCRTPTLDRLAAEGVRFERAYVPVSLCTPSRSVTYTGLYPHKNGAVGFDDISTSSPTWPEILGAAGVATAQIGKLHVGPAARFPFEHLVEARKPADDGREHEFFVGALKRFLDRVEQRPFVAIVNLYDPHRPFFRVGMSSQPEILDPSEVRLLPHEPDTRFARLDLARYWGAVERLDTTCERLLDVLAERGLLDSTAVLYTSDNGRSFPFAKSTLYEAGTNVPLIVRWPGTPARGVVDRGFATTADLLPTILDSFDVEPPELDGRSLLGRFVGRAASERTEVVTTIEGNLHGEFPSRAVRTERYKYIVNLYSEEFVSSTTRRRTWKSWAKNADEDPRARASMDRLQHRPVEELFDLDDDPFELTNLAADPTWSDELREARQRLRAWMRAMDDPRLEELPY